MMNRIELIGFIAAILTTFGFVPQVYKTIKTKSVEGVSLTMYFVLFIGIVCWFFYGILINSLSIIAANLASGLLVLILIVLRIMYKKSK